MTSTGRDLEEGGAVEMTRRNALLSGDHALVYFVALVAENDLVDRTGLRGLGGELVVSFKGCEPLVDVIEGGAVRDVVDDENTHRLSVRGLK